MTARSKSIPAGSGRSLATLTFRALLDSTFAPPGAYLLFIVDSFGVPSEGQWTMVGSPAHARDATFISENTPSTMVLVEEQDVSVTMRTDTPGNRRPRFGSVRTTRTTTSDGVWAGSNGRTSETNRTR